MMDSCRFSLTHNLQMPLSACFVGTSPREAASCLPPLIYSPVNSWSTAQFQTYPTELATPKIVHSVKRKDLNSTWERETSELCLTLITPMGNSHWKSDFMRPVAFNRLWTSAPGFLVPLLSFLLPQVNQVSLECERFSEDLELRKCLLATAF